MTQVAARYYDGRSSQLRNVTIWWDPGSRLRVVGEGVELSFALDEVRASSRVGNTRRHLYFPDGSQCETEDNDAIDRVFVPATARGALLHRWESRLRYVVLALALTLAVVWAAVNYGVPFAAKEIAFHLPPATDKLIGREALESLDKTLLAPTRLPPQRQAELRKLFADMAAADIPGAAGYRLELRASRRIGANALALPSGIVVVTDDLVKLAAKDDELVAVLAHEIGHLRQRHALRRVLEDSATALVIIAVTGDVTSVTAALPAMLVQTKYSRDFEREADDFAFDYLKRHAIPTEALAAILLRMEKQKGAGHVPDYLSTHPSTQERAERSRAAD